MCIRDSYCAASTRATWLQSVGLKAIACARSHSESWVWHRQIPHSSSQYSVRLESKLDARSKRVSLSSQRMVCGWKYCPATSLIGRRVNSLPSVEVNSRIGGPVSPWAVSYTHLRAHETVLDLVC